jgi:uncharacterized phage infection (PIP) family protein YhgE
MMSAYPNRTSNLSAAGTRLRSVADHLTSFLQGSDEAFLHTGAGVQEMERGVRDLLDLSSQVGALSAGSDDPVASLRRELTLLEEHLGTSRAITLEGSAALASVLEGAQRLAAFRDVFCTILMTLRALASSTKVESTRARAGGANFDTVVEGVRQMGVELAPKFDQVLAEGTAIRDIARAALSRTQLFLDQYQRDSGQLCAATQTGLDGLSSLSMTAASLMSENAANTQKLGANIESIFHSLQVHDVARQIIEHVAEELIAFDVDASAALANTGTPMDEGAWMAEVMHVCRLEAAQLEDARKKLLHGLEDINDTLGTVFRGVDHAAQGLKSLAGGQNGSQMDKARIGISRSTKMFCDFMSHEQEIVASLSKVSSTAGRMAALAQELGWIGGEAKVIGLNAMVKAANVGRDGLPLTILAHAIQDVSETIESCTDSVEAIMNEMVGEASDLATRGDLALREQERTGEQIIARMAGLLAHLDSYRGELANGLASLLTGNARLRRGVDGSAEQLRQMTKRVGLLKQLEAELTTIASGAATVSKETVGDPVRARSASKRYTMESEREVARAILGSAAGDESRPEPESASLGGTIELF